MPLCTNPLSESYPVHISFQRFTRCFCIAYSYTPSRGRWAERHGRGLNPRHRNPYRILALQTDHRILLSCCNFLYYFAFLIFFVNFAGTACGRSAHCHLPLLRGRNISFILIFKNHMLFTIQIFVYRVASESQGEVTKKTIKIFQNGR